MILKGMEESNIGMVINTASLVRSRCVQNLEGILGPKLLPLQSLPTEPEVVDEGRNSQEQVDGDVDDEDNDDDDVVVGVQVA